MQLLSFKNERFWAVIFLLLLSYFTYVHNFWNPAALFWDENYHIASAQKYLNGTFFMEPHPPLGKLMIAAGEAIFHPNAETNQFIGTDYATNPPAGFSFFGFRFFPVMFAWMTVPLVFGIFWMITRNTVWSVLLSFLYVFDNALIVHNRSAMLESTMLFFSALTILSFLLVLSNQDTKKQFTWYSLLFGFAFACALATKAFALLFILLVPVVCYALWPNIKKMWSFVWKAGLMFALVYVGIWHIHFTLAKTIQPSLPDAGYYQASPEYKAIIDAGKTSSLFAIPVMLRDSTKFVSHYERGVPRLDLCKADENGSPWFMWPFGARTINYRWETPDSTAYRYLYLVPNPVGWGLGLLGVVLTGVFLLSYVFHPDSIRLKQPFLLLTFGGLYASYMIAVSRIDRVMYLYHYFLPLLFSFILFGLVFNELQYLGRWKLTESRKTTLLLTIGVLIFASFQFYRPFSFYELMGDKAVERRDLLQIWDLKCVNCPTESPLVVPKA